MAWLGKITEKLADLSNLDFGAQAPPKSQSPQEDSWQGLSWFAGLDLNRIGAQLSVDASSKQDADPVLTDQRQPTSIAEQSRPSQFSGLFGGIGAHLGLQASPESIAETPDARLPDENEVSGRDAEHQGSHFAFPGLFAEDAEPMGVEDIHQSDDIDVLGEFLGGDQPMDAEERAQDARGPKQHIFGGQRHHQTLDHEDAMEAHAVAIWDTSDAEAESSQVESHKLFMTREDLISHWAPFSSYFHPDMQVTVKRSSAPEAAGEAKMQTPEGFHVVSVQHRESVVDANEISFGRYFYFDASPFPAFEFSPYSSFVEQWRQGQLFWTGQVQFSQGAYGSVDLHGIASPAAGRKGREESKPGDFEVGDLIFVVGFHRDLAGTDGQHLNFDESLHFYQTSCVGSRVPFQVSAQYDNLADLGQHMALGIEVDEQELAAVRPVAPVPVGKATVAIIQSGAHTADLSRENSFALSPDIPHEGGAGKVKSSAAWAARRKDFLSAGLKSLERRAQETPYI